MRNCLTGQTNRCALREPPLEPSVPVRTRRGEEHLTINFQCLTVGANLTGVSRSLGVRATEAPTQITSGALKSVARKMPCSRTSHPRNSDKR